MKEEKTKKKKLKKKKKKRKKYQNKTEGKKMSQEELKAYGESILMAVSKHVEFDVSEMSKKIGLEGMSKERKRTGLLKSRVQLPWCGEVCATSCQGVRLNHGLYTQCVGAKEDGEYCRTCGRNGGPKYGNISTRNDEDFAFAGRVVRYSKVMEKLGITREAAEAAAEAAGMTIPESEFEKVAKGRRGRPRKLVDTSSSDSESEPKKRGRPKKQKSVVARSAGEDLIASLMANAAETSSHEDSDTSVASSSEKQVAKEAAKEAEKAAKAAAKAAEKQAKLDAKAAEKEAAKAAKAAEKQAKLDAKAAEKQAKLDAKAAEKQAKLDAKAAEKQAKLDAKAAENEVDKAAELTSVENAAFEEATKELTSVENGAMQEFGDSEEEPDPPTLNLSDTAQEMSEEEEEDDDDDGIEVEEFSWDGKDYIIDPSSGVLYDKTVFEDTGESEEVGHYCSDKKTVVFM